MQKATSLLALAGALAISPLAVASSPILDALKGQGVQIQPLTDQELEKIKGAALIYGQPTPSVTVGLKTHQVTYKGWGNQADHNAYNYIGYYYDPSNNHGVVDTDGNIHRIAGDRWLADRTSGPTTWVGAYAVPVEYHYQILDYYTAVPTAWAFRETAWNRPITKFSW